MFVNHRWTKSNLNNCGVLMWILKEYNWDVMHFKSVELNTKNQEYSVVQIFKKFKKNGVIGISMI